MKKTYKKKITNWIILFCILLSSFTFFSESSKAEESITIWYTDNDSIDDTLLSLIDKFELEKGVTIEAVYKSPDTIRNDYKTAYIMGNAPDLIQADAALIPDLIHGDMIVPISSSDFLEDYMDNAKRSVSYFVRENGNYVIDTLTYYGFPQSMDTLAFIYNVGESSRATIPDISGTWTTADFKSQVTKMNDQSNPADKQFGFTFINFLATEEALFLGHEGVMFSNNTIDKANNQIGTVNSIESLNFTHDFVNTYELTPSFKTGYYVDTLNVLQTDLIYEDFAINGNVSSSMLFANQIKELTSLSIFSDESNFGIAPCPVDDNGQTPYLNVKALMINTQSENKDIAKELCQYLTSEDSMIENAKNEYILPTISSCYDSSELQENLIVQSYLPLIEGASGKFLSRFWIKVESIFNQQCTKMVRDGQNGDICSSALEINWNFEILPEADTPGIGEDISSYNIEGAKKRIAGVNSLMLVSLLGVSSYVIILLKKKRS